MSGIDEVAAVAAGTNDVVMRSPASCWALMI